MKPTIQRIIEFQRLLLQFSHIERVLHRRHKDTYIHENDTEHSYNLAMTAWYISNWFPELDKNKVIRFAMIHDMVEVYAGDTYIYGTEEELASKHQREIDALKKLQNEWSDFPDLTNDIFNYELRDSKEARFVYALDKIMPVMLIYISDGYSWKKNHVTVKMLYEKKKEQVAQSPEILPYFNALHELLLKHPEMINEY